MTTDKSKTDAAQAKADAQAKRAAEAEAHRVATRAAVEAMESEPTAENFEAACSALASATLWDQQSALDVLGFGFGFMTDAKHELDIATAGVGTAKERLMDSFAAIGAMPGAPIETKAWKAFKASAIKFVLARDTGNRPKLAESTIGNLLSTCKQVARLAHERTLSNSAKDGARAWQSIKAAAAEALPDATATERLEAALTATRAVLDSGAPNAKLDADGVKSALDAAAQRRADSVRDGKTKADAAREAARESALDPAQAGSGQVLVKADGSHDVGVTRPDASTVRTRAFAAVEAMAGLGVPADIVGQIKAEIEAALREAAERDAAPETPAPETPAPETPAPETPAPETPDETADSKAEREAAAEAAAATAALAAAATRSGNGKPRKSRGH